MRHRVVPLGICLILLLSLGLARHAAQAEDIQLCGYTQFVDLVIIGASVQDGSRLLIPSTWTQIAPHLYTLLGSGVIIRDPLEPSRFLGGVTLANDGDSFGANPVCGVRTTLELNDPALPSLVGTALIRCIGGPSAPFEVTLDLTLTTCDEPGFPGTEEVPEAQAARGSAGEAPNAYGSR